MTRLSRCGRIRTRIWQRNMGPVRIYTQKIQIELLCPLAHNFPMLAKVFAAAHTPQKPSFVTISPPRALYAMTQ
jgi:hypothetical protein